MRRVTLGLLVACPAAILLAPAVAAAEPVCGTVEAFNQAMADAGTTATEVTLTFDVLGVDPNDFAGSKGSLAQMRNTTCAAGQDAVIKVYGPEDPPNVAHPSGTLKLEHGNACCGGECGEQWADPNASAVVFVDGTEQCAVTMWITLSIVIWLAWAARGLKSIQRAALLVIGAAVLQAIIGYTQYFTHLPMGMVFAHMVGTTLYTVAISHLWRSAAPEAQKNSGSTAAARKTTAR